MANEEREKGKKIPAEIVEKMKQANLLMAEIDRWMDENLNLEGSPHNHRDWDGNYNHPDHYEFTDEPQGEEQNDGEYCDQWIIGESCDSCEGFYYYPTETGEYFYFHYWL